MSKRLNASERRKIIVATAVKIGRDRGVLDINQERVARECPAESSLSTVRRYFHTNMDLREAAGEADADIAAQIKELGLD